MKLPASSRLIPVPRASPKSLRPYAMPKLTILATRRISAVTLSIDTLKTKAAVEAWMSSSRWKAPIRLGSLVT